MSNQLKTGDVVEVKEPISVKIDDGCQCSECRSKGAYIAPPGKYCYTNTYLVNIAPFKSRKNHLVPPNFQATYNLYTPANPSETNLMFDLLVPRGGSVRVGCDPEVFVETPERLVPAWEVAPTKEDATPTTKRVGWDAINIPSTFADGVAVEMTPEARACHEEVVWRVQRGLKVILENARVKVPDARLSLSPVVEVPSEVLWQADAEQVALGCSPSYNAYDEEPLRVENPRLLQWRCAGYHMHYGLRDLHPTFSFDDYRHIVKVMDAVWGVASVALAAGIDRPERRRLIGDAGYGRAGEFRLPAHGLEYRVCSNWPLHHPAANHLALDLARASMWMGVHHLEWMIKDYNESDVRRIINSTDVEGAREWVRNNEELYTTIINSLYGDYGNKAPSVAWYALNNGISSVLPQCSIEKAWGLNNSWEGLCTNLKWAKVDSWVVAPKTRRAA